MAASRKLRMGMVGGGPGAFIGPVHRLAAEMDGRIQMVAGAFSQSAEKSRAAGESFDIDPARAYADYLTDAGLAQLVSHVMSRRTDDDDAAVLDVRGEDRAVGREHRIVGVVEVAGF